MSDSPSTEHDHPSQKKSVLNATQKQTITIMLIGETGAGKTTFMSLLVNLFQGHTLRELADKHDKGKESGLDVSKSQTTKATLYTVTSTDGTKLRILDTPGLADTAGITKDEEHMKTINDAVKAHVEEIDAVCILANGSAQRLTDGMKYTIQTIGAMFPQSIKDNIGLMFTNASATKLNFEMSSLKELDLQDCPNWKIQNPLATYKKYLELEKKKDTDPEVLEDEFDDVKKDYRRAVAELNKWLKWLDGLYVQRTHAISELYNRSIDINQNIQKTLSKLGTLQEQELKSKEAEAALKNAHDAKDAVEDFLNKETPKEWVAHRTERFNTICTKCWNSCHAPCGMHQMDGATEIAKWCSAFIKHRGNFLVSRGLGGLNLICDKCNHEARDHQHEFNTYTEQDRPAYVDLKAKVNAATTDEEKRQVALNGIREEIEKLNQELLQAQQTIQELVEAYNKLALSKSFVGHINATIDLLNVRKKELQSKPNTTESIKMIDELLEKLHRKLDIISGKIRG